VPGLTGAEDTVWPSTARMIVSVPHFTHGTLPDSRRVEHLGAATRDDPIRARDAA
ncbi:MAG: hypothetical protein JOZ58_02360, partial [Acetobacteraceae bacterium]|nr:hypothetical protein [Acetobacteraceae bacterium]